MLAGLAGCLAGWAGLLALRELAWPVDHLVVAWPVDHLVVPLGSFRGGPDFVRVDPPRAHATVLGAKPPGDRLER